MMHLTHTPPASTTEMLDVLALFPNCSRCGGSMRVMDPLEPDPAHAFRLKHLGPCPTTPRTALSETFALTRIDTVLTVEGDKR